MSLMKCKKEFSKKEEKESCKNNICKEKKEICKENTCKDQKESCKENIYKEEKESCKNNICKDFCKSPSDSCSKYYSGSTTTFLHDTSRPFDQFGLGTFDTAIVLFEGYFDPSNLSVLVVSAAPNGIITIGSLLQDINMMVVPGTTIVSYGPGTTGRLGTYNVFPAQTAAIPFEPMITTGSGALITEDTRGTYTLVTEIWYPVDKCDVKHNTTKAYFYDFYFASGPNDINAYNTFLQAESLADYTPNTSEHDPTAFRYQQYYKGDVLTDADPRYIAATKLAFITARNSYKDAPIAKGKFPVIILNHGYQDCRITHHRQAEYLAENGFIVIACDITGVANLTLIGKDPELNLFNNDFLIQNEILDSFGAYEFNFGNTNFGSTTSGMAMYEIQLDEEYIQAIGSILKCIPTLNASGFFLIN